MKRKTILPIIALTIFVLAFICTIFLIGCSSDDNGSESNETVSLKGTVRDSATGTVISGATVKIDNAETTTDSDGNYTLSGITVGTYTITVSKNGYQDYQASITIVEGTNTKNITLTAETTQTGTLTGTVKYGDSPVEGVLIQLQGVGDYTAAADGVYTFSQVSYGTYTITAAKTGFTDYTASVTINAATNTHNISLTTSNDLPVPGAGKGHVTGYVTDDSGNSLENVKCTLYKMSGKGVGKFVVVYTDADGRYVFLNVDPGTYQLVFSLGGYNIPYIIVTVTSGTITEPPVNPGTPANPDPGIDTPVVYRFQYNYGGSLDDYATSVDLLPDGGYIVAGCSNSSSSGDFTGVSKGNNDYWLLRLNSQGQILWQKNYGGNGSEQASQVNKTSDGGYIVGGNTTSSANGDVTGVSNGSNDFWIVKLDNSGTIQWQKNLGGSGDDYCESVQQTSDGGYIAAGYTGSSASGDVTGVNNGNYDFWVVKLNDSGVIQWQKNYGGSAGDIAKDIKPTSDGGYIVTGFTYSSASGDVTGVNNGVTDYWIVKLNSSGIIEWQKNYGGNAVEVGREVYQTSDGGYIVAGSTASSANGDVTGVNNGAEDFWIVKLNSLGAIEWQKNYGGSADDNASSIQQTPDGSYIISGYTYSSATGDVTGANKGNGDFWIVKINSTGILDWQYNYGGNQIDEAYSVHQTGDGGYVVAGMTESSASGDVTGANKGGEDYWIMKLTSNGLLK